MVHFESCFWEVCVSLIMSIFFLLDTMNRTFAWPTNHVSIICSQLLLCISSAVSYTFQPHCWINKCHRLLQSGTYPINFATWKTIWNEINSRDVQTTSMVCYATTAHFNTASIFLFNYFFFTCSNWICFSTFNHDLFKSHSAAKPFPQDYRKHLVYNSFCPSLAMLSIIYPFLSI